MPAVPGWAWALPPELAWVPVLVPGLGLELQGAVPGWQLVSAPGSEPGLEAVRAWVPGPERQLGPGRW
jgi:hypothetical protein